MRALLFSFLLIAAAAVIPPAAAQDLPEIPDSQRILSLEEVKNYWVNMLPEPREPSRLARDYRSLIVDYHRQVGERHRLIQAIRAGDYDRFALISMLRHNLQAHRLRGDDAEAAALSAELEELEAVTRREEAERANADRLERLIAATERLAAAIENNGGIVPAGADEIVPFERYEDDAGGLMNYLYDEIALCRQPLIIPAGHGHRHADHRHHGRADHGGHVRPDHEVQAPSTARLRPAPAVVRPGPSPVPVRASPQVRPGPKPSAMPSQPQVRPVRAPMQPQVRQAR